MNGERGPARARRNLLERRFRVLTKYTLKIVIVKVNSGHIPKAPSGRGLRVAVGEPARQ